MSVTPADVARAVDALRAGELVAFPTETVYGLGADASSPAALARLYAAKRRPSEHPVIVHVPSAAALDDWAIGVPAAARRLADAFWPGPLTLVLHRAPPVLDAVTGGQPTVGLRVPDQPVALDLLHAFGGGIAAPSANRFGCVSPTTAADVRHDLDDDVAIVLDGGPCRVGVESTIVDCTHVPLRILRLGGVARDALAVAAGEPVERARAGDDARAPEVRAPGGLSSHYAPRARVRVVERAAELHRAVGDELGEHEHDDRFRVGVIMAPGVADDGPISGSSAAPGDRRGRRVLLGRPANVEEYAHDLYHWLRAADEQRLAVVVAVAPPDDDALGAAVADRLRRAAAPRPADENGAGT